MAYETLATYKIAEWQQEEVIDTQLIAGEDGVVTEVTTVVQPYAKVTAEFIFKQELLSTENKSYIEAQLWVHAEAGEQGDGFTIDPNIPYTFGSSGTNLFLSDEYNYGIDYPEDFSDTMIEVESGTKVSKMVGYFRTKNNTVWYKIGTRLTGFYAMEGRHYFDGSFAGLQEREKTGTYSLQIENLTFTGNVHLTTTNLLINGELPSVYYNLINKDFNYDLNDVIKATDRSTPISTANSFNDEENPSLTYQTSSQNFYVSNKIYRESVDTVSRLQAALSFDGVIPDISYRDISVDSTSYTFELTEAEREVLRAKAQGSTTVPIYYLLKTTRTYGSESMDFINKSQRNLTIVGCNPSIDPIVKDIKLETLALTGDENTFIRYESMAEYVINATASKNATIVSQSVQCGSKTITDLPQGVIDDTESGTFIFNVTDSRGMGASTSVFKKLIEYVKPTCYQKVEIKLSGETGANIKLTVNGNYFNGSFGAADNELLLEVRYTDDSGNMGEWITLTGNPTFNGSSYELENTFSGFDYGKAYVFQCRATDKLNVVQSSQYTIRLAPVFDWSETDFNFNVPVNINADNLTMHDKTIIRHSNTTNNTVLSANGGHIYIRPNGTNDTSGETIMYSNGNVDFNGNVNFNGVANFNYSFTIGGYILNDYVIETGSEAMGSNGTWYWRKWLSGKAECWGCRNFGNMAVTTAWGSLYRSAVFTQDLPDGVFKRTPDAININFVHTNNGGWISKYENTAPSAITTGSFVVVRPVSGNLTPTNIGFYIIGEWQ